MATRGLVVFDGDDTLWRTQEIYDEIKSRFVDLVRALGLGGPDLLSTLDDIDAEAARRRGFTVQRFIESMLETYRVESAVAGHAPAQSMESQITELAQPLLGDYELYPDVVPVLERLMGRFELVLATKGQRDLQEQKVRRLGIARFFARVYFLDQKTEAEFQHFLVEHHVAPEAAWSVGNSIRSDINPALRVGMHAIWIRRPTWLYEEAPIDVVDVPAVDSLTEAAEVLLAHGFGQRRAVGTRR